MESGFCVSVESLVPLRGWPSRINRDKQWLPEKELGSVCECWRSLCWGWPCRAGHGASGWCDLAARATAAPLHPAASLCRESSAGEQECFWSLLCWGLQKHFKKNLKKKKKKRNWRTVPQMCPELVQFHWLQWSYGDLHQLRFQPGVPTAYFKCLKSIYVT